MGAGNFGCCLAQHLAEKGYLVQLYDRNKDVVNALNNDHKHPRLSSKNKLLTAHYRHPGCK